MNTTIKIGPLKTNLAGLLLLTICIAAIANGNWEPVGLLVVMHLLAYQYGNKLLAYVADNNIRHFQNKDKKDYIKPITIREEIH